MRERHEGEFFANTSCRRRRRGARREEEKRGRKKGRRKDEGGKGKQKWRKGRKKSARERPSVGEEVTTERKLIKGRHKRKGERRELK